jgi:FkbM family methyltransferase
MQPELKALLTVPRVPLPVDVQDDDHNRVGGLIDLITEYFPKDAVVLELGSGRGVSTRALALTCKTVVTVDVFFDEEWRAEFIKNTGEFSNVRLWRCRTDDQKLLDEYPDGYFDAIYVDAVHNYEGVRADILNFTPKVKRGGVIAGHDFIDRPAHHHFGTIRAVCEIFGHPEKVFCDTSWVVRKNFEYSTPNKVKYYSEHGQDRWLVENIFKNRLAGTFFEAGAIDGLITSNSLFFEKYRGWSGLLVEANPEEYAKIARNRPGCASENCAIVSNPLIKTVPFLKCGGDLVGWSGVVGQIEPQHAARVAKEIPQQEIIEVPAMTLEALLDKHRLRNIDYITLDIEGGEYHVLTATDWREYNVSVFDIEDNFGNYPIEDFMKFIGYKKTVRLGVSDIYIKNAG